MAAASAFKKRVIGGGWAAVLAGGGLYTYKSLSEFPERAPCVRDAISTVSASPAARQILGAESADGLRLVWWTGRLSVNKIKGRANASFRVDGPTGSAQVVLGARKTPKFVAPGVVDVGEDEDDLDVGVFSYYWTRPWELKFAILNKLRWLQGADPIKKPANLEVDEVVPWELETIFILPHGKNQSDPLVLMGEARGLPEHEMLLRRDADVKSDKSRWRLHVFGGLVVLAAAAAGGLRLSKSISVSQGFGKAKKALLTHPSVVDLLGSGATVQTTSGTFSSSYVNARLRLVGRNGAAADVDYTATRDASSGPWRVLLARMRTGGRSYELDRSRL